MKNEQISGWALFRQSWGGALELMALKRRIFLPFGIIAAIELLGILALFLLIQPPWVKYVQPLVARFWGPAFLHYPLNLILLMRLWYYFQIFVAAVLGTYMSALVMKAAEVFWQTKQIVLRQLILPLLRYYVGVLLIGLIVIGLVQWLGGIEEKILGKILRKGADFLGIARKDWLLVFAVLGIGTAGFVQAVFAYVQPLFLLKNKNILSAFVINFRYFFKNWLPITALMLLPLLFYLPFAMARARILDVMQAAAPEIVFVLLLGSVLYSWVLNTFLTVAVTRMYLLLEGDERGAGQR
ncbi:MAG: hypothetical protein NC924_00685 [Candidatus Omnitrophica bacterium]|nr:hypothetical protein [Candidatus Omnitrophota bacterium]